MGRSRQPAILLRICLAASLLTAQAALAGGAWSGSISLALIEQSIGGSEASYRSQINLDDGITLEAVDLQFLGEEGEGAELTLRASGFGSAEPAQRLDLDLDLAKPWSFELDYDRRESIFALAEHERSVRSDDWEIERWHAGVAWDGWNAARLRLDVRSHDKSGSVVRPILALNQLYPLRVDLDESMTETAFSIETRALPFTVLFEHSLATYKRDNRRQPAGSENLGGGDPDLFAAADESRSEERDVPTSRLVLTYANPRLELAAAVLYSPAELDGSGPVSSSFDILGGLVGRVALVDDFLSSAEMDTFAGNLRLGVALASNWTLRLEADTRDASTDATLLGERILRITNPFGMNFDFAEAVDETSRYDVTDEHARVTVEWGDRGLALWAGAANASRDVSWRLGNDDPGLDVSRDSDGFLAGASWSRRGVKGSVEYESNSFDRFVFRTDPETVDRLTFKLGAELSGGWHARLQGRLEEADSSPAAGEERAATDRSSDSWGAGVAWTSEDGGSAFGIDVDQLELAADTSLVLPDGRPDVSIYDLSLLSWSVHGRTHFGRARLDGSATRLDDSGETWPVSSWIARARVGYEINEALEATVFGEYWDYDEELAEGDDYDVTRYGLGLRWSIR